MFKRMLCLVILFAPFSLCAQDSITLDGLFKRVLQHHPTLEISRQNQQRAVLGLQSARGSKLPVLQFSSVARYQSEIPELSLPFTLPDGSRPQIEAGARDQYDAAFEVNQQLFTGFRTSRHIDAATATIQAADAEYEIHRSLLLLRAGMLWYDLQSHLQQIALLNASEQRVQTLLKQLRARVAAQQLSAGDTLDAAAQLLQVHSARQLASLQSETVRFALAQLAQVDSLPKAEIAELILPAPPSPLDESLALAIANRPELAQLSAMERAGRAQAKAAMHYRYPKVFANASYHYARPGVNFFEDEWMTYATAGVKLQWQLFDGNRSRNQAQQAELAVNELALRQLEIASQVRESVLAAHAALKSQLALVAQQQQRVDIEIQRYDHAVLRHAEQQMTSLDLSLLESQRREAEIHLRQLLAQANKAALTLSWASGTIARNLEEE